MLYDEFDRLESESAPAERRPAHAVQRSTPILHNEAVFMHLPPSALLASDLFQAVYARKRPVVSRLPLASTDSARTMRYSGERLDQFDLDVLLACMESSAHTGRRTGTCVGMMTGGIARAMKRPDDRATRRKTALSLQRMACGLLEVSNGRLHYTLRIINRLLLDSTQDRCVVEFSPQVFAALRSLPDMRSFTRSRFALRARSLERWLHGMVYVSSEMCIPFDQLGPLSGGCAGSRTALHATVRQLCTAGALPVQGEDEAGIVISRG
jgi:hypothetical protein